MPLTVTCKHSTLLLKHEYHMVNRMSGSMECCQGCTLYREHLTLLDIRLGGTWLVFEDLCLGTELQQIWESANMVAVPMC